MAVQEGDIINVDVTVFHDGVHGDCSETVLVGQVDDDIYDLVKTTYECWKAAISICKPGKQPIYILYIIYRLCLMLLLLLLL